MLTHGILAAIPTSYFSSHSLAPFSEHSLPSQSARITIASMATAKYISGIPVSPQFWLFYRWFYSSGSPWISSPEWNAGSTTTESSAPKYNAGWSESRRFCSHLPAGNPVISSPTWHMVCKEPFLMDGNHKVRCQMIHISLVLAYQPIPTPQLIRKCLPSWNAEIPAVWISFAKCKSKLSASSI